ncbi:unnamed protein product [Phytophthora fragariaefolia]|uniref:Unnamed protein product n=1 Tax=Phytophthora fragariaefolia TaxID=1490495 RepID=A0A9W6XW85_9STRA|nr:unnamed protein product [Phytophthora fragariaefolia]
MPIVLVLNTLASATRPGHMHDTSQKRPLQSTTACKTTLYQFFRLKPRGERPRAGKSKGRYDSGAGGALIQRWAIEGPNAGLDPRWDSYIAGGTGVRRISRSTRRRHGSLATAQYPLHDDSALRGMTPAKVATTEAYVSRRLALPAPPTFLRYTVTAIKRAVLLAFHHEHVEAALIADVPVNARLGKHISRQSILCEMVTGNAQDETGKIRMKKLIKAAQRITFDGEHTLTVVFMSRSEAKDWGGETFRLLGCGPRYPATVGGGTTVHRDTGGLQGPRRGGSDFEEVLEAEELMETGSYEEPERGGASITQRGKFSPDAGEHGQASTHAPALSADLVDVDMEEDTGPDDSHSRTDGSHRPLHTAASTDLIIDDAMEMDMGTEDSIARARPVGNDEAQGIPYTGADGLQGTHSPSSETDPSQKPYWHSTSTVSQVRPAAGDFVADSYFLRPLMLKVRARRVTGSSWTRLLYPDDVPPKIQEVYAAALFAHYSKMSEVSVATPVPQTFREGPTVLRAMTVYLREPAYVWDIGIDDSAYAQQYSYRTFTMDNGGHHETGVVTPLTEGRVRDILEACYNHHVPPTMLLLNHNEGHFYGVQHGDTFHEWYAQPDSNMRERLDQVHAALGLPILPSDGYEPEYVTAEAKLEEQALLVEMGFDCYTSGSQASEASSTLPIRASRVPVNPQAGVYRHVYERLLKTAEKTDRKAIDARLVARLQDANEAAFSRWVSNDGRSFGIPKLSTRQPPLIDCTREQVLRWGELEAYRHQIQTIEWIANYGDNEDATGQFCGEWLERCSAASTPDAAELARDRQRWSDLGQLVDESLIRLRPLDIPLEHWFILHVLPYVIQYWADTATGRAPTGSRATWYHEYQHVQQLCTGVADNRNWSEAMRLPLGNKRTDLIAVSAKALSFGSGDSTTTTGVGILVHPRGRFQNLQPAFQDPWTPHFMVVKVALDGEVVHIANFYAPTEKRARENFCLQLTTLPVPHGTLLIVGGDFNCTQHGTIDRSFEQTALNPSSPALEEMLNKWQLADSLASVLPKPSDSDHVRWFHAEHHTHSYPVPGHSLASSRLDRWYTNDTARPWVAATAVDNDGLQLDHKGVQLHLRYPTDPIRARKATRVYPVPAFAKERADLVVTTGLNKLSRNVSSRLMRGATAKQRSRFLSVSPVSSLTTLYPASEPWTEEPWLDPAGKAEALAASWSPIIQGTPTLPKSVEQVGAWMTQMEEEDVHHLGSAGMINEPQLRWLSEHVNRGKRAGRIDSATTGTGHTVTRLSRCSLSYTNYGMITPCFPPPLWKLTYYVSKRVGTGVRKSLSRRVSVYQNGFVPGRQIHATIDYLEAAQRMAQSTPAARNALALLLDFAKADNGPVSCEWAHTSATEVTRGIRQGCHLAPILFVLALEPLYQKLHSGNAHQGVLLHTASARIALRLADYADDTAIYINNPRELPHVVETVEVFGDASGLRLNMGKTVAFALYPDGLHPDEDWKGVVKLLDRADTCRYLGIQVGTMATPQYIWTKAGEQLTVRLRLACQRTLTIDQRSRIAAAIIIPKLLNVGRHAWPDTQTVNLCSKRIKNYIWHGCFSITAPTSSTWLYADIGGLPRDGLSATAGRTLSDGCVTVSDWALTGSLTDHVIGDILYPAQPARAAPMVAGMVSKAGAPSLSLLPATIAEVIFHGPRSTTTGLTMGRPHHNAPRPTVGRWCNGGPSIEASKPHRDALPRMAPPHGTELRLYAAPVDYPLVAQIARGLLESPTATLTLTTNGEDPGTAIQISSRPDAAQYLNSVAGSAVPVRDIHPTPILNRMAITWAQKRPWQQKRHAYKNLIRAKATGRRKNQTYGQRGSLGGRPSHH